MHYHSSPQYFVLLSSAIICLNNYEIINLDAIKTFLHFMIGSKIVSYHRVQCTYCGADTEDNFTSCGIAIAIFCFPIGSVRSFISLTIHWIKCHHIDFSSSQVLPSPTVNFSQQTLFILPLNHN